MLEGRPRRGSPRRGWDERLRGEVEEPYWYELLEFHADERGRHDVFPPPSLTFKASELTPYDEVRVVILGQDPTCVLLHRTSLSSD